MKIAQLIEAKYQSKPTYRNLSNEKIIELFLVYEPEMSEEEGEDGPKHYYTRKEIHIYDKDEHGGEVNWLVVYKKGTHRERVPGGRIGQIQYNDKPVYFVVDHDSNRDWQTDPQKWTVSHLQVLFDG